MPEYTERFNDLCHDLELVFGKSAYHDGSFHGGIMFNENQAAIAEVIMNHGIGGFIYSNSQVPEIPPPPHHLTASLNKPTNEETNMGFKYETKHFIDDVCIEEMTERQLLMKIEAAEKVWQRLSKIKGDEESEGLDKLMTDALETKEKLLKHLDKKVLKDSQS